MKNLKQWITTSIGLILMVGTIYQYFWEDAGTIEALVVFAIGIFLLRASDNKILSVVNSIGDAIKKKGKEL